ncbi:hypothetical protein BT69DRAFT_663637 [Atractiella rhizophila]|nr:hypothetical protein BT69DRAFT_663637 [Atractiella rhizophila]
MSMGQTWTSDSGEGRCDKGSIINMVCFAPPDIPHRPMPLPCSMPPSLIFSLPPHRPLSVGLRLGLHGSTSTDACFVTSRSTMKWLLEKGRPWGQWWTRATRGCLGRPLSHAHKHLPSAPLVSRY